MTRRTLRHLWRRYLDARRRLGEERVEAVRRRALEREVAGIRDRLLVNYSPLVRYVAGKISARATGPVDMEDVMSWGVVGLLDAIETYDPARGTKFESYAISKIRWAVVDELRRADPLTRRLRTRAREMESARDRLAQRLGRAPTEAEVARELGVEVSEHRAFLQRYSLARVGSLEAPVESGEVPGCELHQLVADNSASDPQMAAERAEVRDRLTGAIMTLGEQERVVTTFYFYEGLTLREIGRALNLTEGRISQILRRALAKLRGALPEGLEPSGGW